MENRLRANAPALSPQEIIAQTVAVATSRVASAPSPQELNNAYANTIMEIANNGPIAVASMTSALSDADRLKLRAMISGPVEGSPESVVESAKKLKEPTATIPLAFFSGVRDNAAALHTSSMSTSITTHHTLQNEALTLCGARQDASAAAAPGAKKVNNASRTALAWRYGSGGPAAERIHKKAMTATDKKLVQGTTTGAGAAVPEYEIQPPAEKQRKMSELNPMKIYTTAVQKLKDNERLGFADITSTLPSVSSKQSQLVSPHDPLTGISHNVVRLDSDLLNSMVTNTATVNTTNKFLSQAIEDAGYAHVEHIAMDVDAADKTAEDARAVATLPKQQKFSRKRKGMTSIEDDDVPMYYPGMEITGTTKVTVDPTILENPDIAERNKKAIARKDLVQMQNEDSDVLTAPFRNSSGPAGLVPYVLSRTNLDTVRTAVSAIADVLSVLFSGHVANNYVDDATIKLTGISIQDAKYCAEKRHPEIPLVQFPTIMRKRMRNLFENDNLFKALGLEKDIETRLRAQGIDGHVGYNVESVDYIMRDIGMKSNHAESDNMQRLAAVAQRGAIFAAFEEQQKRLASKGYDHYGSKKKWHVSEQLAAAKAESATKYPDMEVVTMAHITKYCIEHTLEDLKRTGKRLCKNGASCWCKQIANTRYPRMFNGPPAFPKAADVDKSIAGNIPMNFITKISMDQHVYFGTAAQWFSRPQLMANLNAVAESNAQTRANLGFVGVEFLTPKQEQELAEWWAQFKDDEIFGISIDPRRNFNQLCYLCEMFRVTSEHVMHVNQRVPDEMQNVDPRTRDYLPLNTFQVLHSIPGEYDKDALIETSIGAGVSGSTRLPSGRSLVVGPFPEFRLSNFELSVISIPNEDGVETTRRIVKQPGMDFRLSSVM